MPKNIPLEQLKLYFNGNKFHKCYPETVELYRKIQTHADGLVPEKLINERRPSESDEVMKYRKQIYVPKTKNPFVKVFSSLSKIRRSPDWSINYDPTKAPAAIVPEETLKTYCEENYPGHGSVTNWAFSHLLKNKGVDANAVIAVIPTNWDAATRNEYYKPVAIIFNSDHVLYFEDGGDYAILKSTDRSDLIKDDNTMDYQAGRVYYVITTMEYEKYEENKLGEFIRTEYIPHGKGKLPVFKVKAQFLKQKDSTTIQESRLNGMIPSLDEAAREYSDLQAAKVQHMFPLFWYSSSKACSHCGGIGKVIDHSSALPKNVTCSVCEGSGKVKFSPYAHLEVEPPKMGESTMPIPPAGYIGRDVEIIKLQDQCVKAHVYDALSAVNMQFLDQTPLTISGDAKNVDREELTNFVYNFAEDMVMDIDMVYYWTNEWRYAVVVPDQNARKAMLPEIPVPENFDLLPADYLMDELSKAKTAKVNPILVATMERSYAMKKFYTTPEVANQIDCYYDLDPLPGLTVDEKMSLLSNKGITQEDYVISAYIPSFVKRAIAEDKDFLSKKMEDKFTVMQKYAGEKMKATDKAEEVKQEMLLEQQKAAAAISSPTNKVPFGN